MHEPAERLGHASPSGGEFETGAQTKSVLRWGISDRRDLGTLRLALTVTTELSHRAPDQFQCRSVRYALRRTVGVAAVSQILGKLGGVSSFEGGSQPSFEFAHRH